MKKVIFFKSFVIIFYFNFFSMRRSSLIQSKFDRI
jgi:hypothetical protein